MVHRSTPLASVHRAYSGGGARALIENVEDSQLMQAMTGQGNAGESFSANKDGSFKGPESPQNYGFTSVVADATKGANGMIKQCAEGFMSFMGGNRSFPVCGVMDDRRHRLKNLAKDAAKGAVAMFGLKEWGQQFLNTEDGMFMTGNTEKKIRTALVQNQNGKTQQQQPQQKGAAGATRGAPEPIKFTSKSGVEFEIEVFAAGDGGGGGGGGGNGASQGQQGDSKPTGQKTLHKEESDTFHEITKDHQHLTRGSGNVKIEDKQTRTFHKETTKSTRADDDHVHIYFKGAHVWVTEDGCYSSKPFVIKPDPCGG